MKKFNLKKIIILWFPVLIRALMIFYFSSQPTGRASQVDWQDFSIKKTAHVFIYAVLSTLIFRALIGYKILLQKSAKISVLLSSFYGLTDEIHQSFTAGREPTIRDVIIDSIGSFLAIYLIIKYLPKLKEKHLVFKLLYNFIYET